MQYIRGAGPALLGIGITILLGCVIVALAWIMGHVLALFGWTGLAEAVEDGWED